MGDSSFSWSVCFGCSLRDWELLAGGASCGALRFVACPGLACFERCWLMFVGAFLGGEGLEVCAWHGAWAEGDSSRADRVPDAVFPWAFRRLLVYWGVFEDVRRDVR